MRYDDPSRRNVLQLGGACVTGLAAGTLGLFPTNVSAQETVMTGVTLTVLYPHPIDPDQFEAEYPAHIDLLHEKTGIPKDQKPYTLLKFLPNPDGSAPPFYRCFLMPFPSVEAMGSPEFQAVAADAQRLSTGGDLVIMVGAS